MKFLNIFIDKPIIAHFLFIAVLFFGLFSIYTIPVEENPEIDLGYVIIITRYPGASPREIERLITVPIEDAVSVVDDIDFLRSGSQNGRSSVFMMFNENVTDIDRKVMDIQTEINKIPDLPSKNEMAGPFVFKISMGDTQPVLNVMLSSPSISDQEFKLISENLERELTTKITGIKNIQIAGVSEEEIDIIIDNETLFTYGLTIDDIYMAVTSSNFRTPGGTLDISGRRYLVRTSGTIDDLDKINNILVKTGQSGQKLYLKDVANVERRFVRGRIQSFLNGEKALSLYIMRKPDSNIVDVNKEVKKIVDQFSKQFDDMKVSYKNDQGEAINETISVLRNNALLGIVLVSILLFFFIGWRASFLAVIGIPFSFLATFLMMRFFGYTINSLSLFAMIIVSGMLVDDAIVVIENVYRYREEGLSSKDAVLKGTSEIMWPIISAIATTICAFIPLLLISGMIGKFLSLMPVIVAITLAASLIEALIVLPVHLYEMKNMYNEEKKPSRKWFEGILGKYTKMLNFSLRFRYFSILCVILVFISAVYVAKNLRVVLFGDVPAKTVSAKMELPENTPIERTRELSKEIENHIIKELYPEYIDSVVTIVGRVIEDRRWMEKEEVAEFRIDLRDYNEDMMNRVRETVRSKALSMPDIINFEFLRASSGPPSGRAIDVRVSGKDIDVLEKIGDSITDFLRSVSGVVDLRASVQDKINEILIDPDYERLEQTGVTLNSVAEAVRAATAGRYSGRYLDEDGKELRMWIRFDQNREHILDDIRNIPVKSRTGSIYRIGDVSLIKEVQSIARIRRSDRQREARVGANVDYSQITPYEANLKIKENFGDIGDEYPGVSLRLEGEFEDQQKANRDIILAFLVAIVLIYIILGIQFNSPFQPIIIMITIPLAFIGVAYGLFISGLDLSLLALIALVALAGIVVNDSIILVDFINNLSKTKERREALIEAGSKRLRPILLTTVTTIGGLMPMALFAEGGNKMWQPMAITIIWGIMFATVLTLFVIPVIYAIIDDARALFFKVCGKKCSK
jgi:multidrug efflux pump